MGAMPTIHSRRPSRENCGNTNRVVTEARFSAQTPRFRKAMRLIQNGLVNWCVKFRRLMMYTPSRPNSITDWPHCVVSRQNMRMSLTASARASRLSQKNAPKDFFHQRRRSFEIHA